MPTSPARIGLVRRAAAVVAVLLVVLTAAACGDSGDEAQTSSTTTSAERSTTTTTEAPTDSRPTTTATTAPTTTPIDPTTPPPTREITPAYVQRVLVHLYGLYRQAFVAAKAENALGERYQALMQSVYTPDAAAQQTSGIQRFGGIPVIAPQPGMPTVRVVRVLSADPTCVFSSVQLDLSPLVTKPLNARQPYYVRLVPENKSASNNTPWLIAYASFTSDGSIPEDDTCP